MSNVKVVSKVRRAPSMVAVKKVKSPIGKRVPYFKTLSKWTFQNWL